MALGPSPAAAKNLLAGLLALIAKLPEEGLVLVGTLINAIARHKDPLTAVRLATMVVLSKKVSVATIERLIGK